MSTLNIITSPLFALILYGDADDIIEDTLATIRAGRAMPLFVSRVYAGVT